MLFVPSHEITFESHLDQSAFVWRLRTHVEPRKKGFKVRVEKDFEGEIDDNGSFSLTYGRGVRLTGKVFQKNGGSLVKMHIRIPAGTEAFGLAFAWGTFLFGLMGIILLAASKPYFSIIGFLRATAIVTVPGLLAYGIMLINLWKSVDFIKEFFEDHFKR